MNGPSSTTLSISRTLSVSQVSETERAIPWMGRYPNGTQRRSPGSTIVPSGTAYVYVRSRSLSEKSTATSTNMIQCAPIDAEKDSAVRGLSNSNSEVKRDSLEDRKLADFSKRPETQRRSLMRACRPVSPRR